MGKWYASLAGNLCDLKAAACCFDLPGATVYENADSGTRLKSSDFDMLTTPHQVEDCAVQILRAINGALRVVRDNYRPIHLWAIHADDWTGYHICGESRDKWHRQNALDERASCGVWFGQSSEVALSKQLFAIARRQPAVARAFDLWGADRHGMSVYKIFEIIRDDLGDKLNALATRAAVNRFTGSVNHPDVLGDYSRHEVLPGDPPRQMMSREEVEKFIQDLLRRWATAK